jgi:hypothetical protein
VLAGIKGRRHRKFIYSEYVLILAEGTEPIPRE